LFEKAIFNNMEESFPPSTAVGTFGNVDKDLHVQPAHSTGLTRLIHARQAIGKDGSKNCRMFTGGDDYLVRILPAEQATNLEAITLEDCTKPISWLDANADLLVVSSEEGYVRIYEYNALIEQQSAGMDLYSTATEPILLTRSAMPVRCASLEKAVNSQKTPRIAVCTDDLTVKVIDAGDPTRVQLLTGHQRGVRAASWSPIEPILVTSSCDGTVMVWDLSTSEPKLLKMLNDIIASGNKYSELNAEAIWHPSGDFFLLPSKTHEIVICSAKNDWRTFDADLNVPEGSSITPTTGDVSFMAFSPNGLYLAVSTTDGQVIVWDWNSKKPINSKRAQALVSGISFHPALDALAWSDCEGQITRWSRVVGPSRQSPFDISLLERSSAKGKNALEADSLFGDDFNDDDVMELERDEPTENVELTSKLKKASKRSRYPSHSVAFNETKAQSTFQPTATPMRNSRRYLAFNAIGSLVTIDQESHQSISFESFDTGARRNWRFVDHFGYNMASIGVHGALMACPEKNGADSFDGTDEDVDEDGNEKDRGHASNIHFKPFEVPGGWSIPGSEWSVDLPRGEHVTALTMAGRRSAQQTALDSCTAIAATSEGYLRFFTGAGIQKYIWAFGSQVISMAAGNRFALIVHRNGAAADYHQNMLYTLIDVSSLEIRQQGVLPLVNGATLTWLGFNDLDMPAIFDSRGVLYILDRALSLSGQARWSPALDTRQVQRDGRRVFEDGIRGTRYWPVGLDGTNLLAILLKGQQYPDASATSRPLIQEVPFSMPVISLSTPAGALEEQLLRQNQLAAFSRAFRSSLSTEEEDDEYYLDLLEQPLAKASTIEHESDKALLQLIQSACKSDQHQRALDAARELHTSRTLEAALQIGAFFHQSSLIDRMNSLRGWIAERRERDDRTMGGVPFISAYNNGQVSHSNPSPRVLVASSPGPAILYGNADRARAKQALGRDFSNPTNGQRSFGTGRSSDLAKLGQQAINSYNVSPSAAAPSSSITPRETEHDDEVCRGSPVATRKRTTSESEDEYDTNSNKRGKESLTTSPFANKTNNSFSRPQAAASSTTTAKNPFARTAGMSRDKSMHKSNSFFDRVENVTQQSNAKPPSKQSSMGKTKQTTLFGITRTSRQPNSSKSTPTPAATPAFGDQESQQSENGFGSEESLRLTLNSAQQRDEESQVRLEETQYSVEGNEEDDESQQRFDAEHQRAASSSIPVA
jgi:chromosome transmission fidelity protein 4